MYLMRCQSACGDGVGPDTGITAAKAVLNRLHTALASTCVTPPCMHTYCHSC